MTEVPAGALPDSPVMRGGLHRPERTCVGCRGKGDRSVLLRLVALERDGVTTVVLDHRRRTPGRGLWLHPDERCLVLAQRRTAFARALRLTGPVDTATVAEQVRAVLQDYQQDPLGETTVRAPSAGTTDREQNADDHPMSTQR